MKMTKKIMLLAGASVSALSLGNSIALAEEGKETFVFEEILVTATKRSESIQDVPLAMTAFDAAFSRRVNLDDVKSLIKFSPGMSGDTNDSFVDYVNVRGISTNDFGVGGDPSIGFFKNGLYQGRNGSAVTSLYDLERAEVLRGPQGFLFGRNSISGAISFHTAKPDFDSLSGHIDLGVGERGIIEGEAAINLPVSENFAIRVAGYTSHENGYVTNDFAPNADKIYGHDKTAARFSAAFRGESWDATVIAEYEDKKGSGTVYRAVDVDGTFDLLSTITGVDVAPGSDLRSINSDLGLGNYDEAEIFSISAEFNIDLDFATLTSLTGFKDHKYRYAEDFDGMPIGFNDYSQDQEGDYFEQELRLVSANDGPLSWYAGVSYFKENIDATFFSRGNEDVMCGAYYYDYYGTSTCAELFEYWEYPEFTPTSGGLLEGNRVIGSYSGWGTYVDLTYAVSDKFDFSAGLRYSKNTKDFSLNVFPVESELGHYYIFAVGTNGFLQDKKSWDDFTPRFIARYRPTDDMMLYASVTKGFKSGGFNSFGIDFAADEDGLPVNADDDGIPTDSTLNSYDPESVWSYEIGLKGNTADNRIRYDINAYYYKYKGLQLSFWDAGTKIDNVGRVTSYGIEGSVQAALNENFDLLLAGSYNSNEINDAEDIAEGSDGNRLGGAPEYKMSGLLSYHTRVTETGEMNASVDFVVQSSVFGGIGNQAEAELDGYADVSIRIGYEDDAGWGITAYVENVFDKKYFDGSVEGAYPFPSLVFGPSRPRTFGAKFSYRFGD
ncbi:MAG: hypothetical protein COB54_01275 [Alphaproteobacteria bacterium]|nr:MAG: hypothetical protein COB54_01275 [Alphaproteobacteria bacterium]